MPLKINVGVCKKTGLPDYGSAGSHCDIELEMDHSVLNDPSEFQRRVRHAYGLCRQAVEDELAGLGGKTVKETEPPMQSRPTPPPKTEYRNSKPPEQNDNRFLATPKQMKFITQLCRGIKGLDNRRLDAYCQEEFGKSSKQLSAHDASKLIDMLKDAKENGGLAT